jgi:hypothetical protein
MDGSQPGSQPGSRPGVRFSMAQSVLDYWNNYLGGAPAWMQKFRDVSRRTAEMTTTCREAAAVHSDPFRGGENLDVPPMEALSRQANTSPDVKGLHGEEPVVAPEPHPKPAGPSPTDTAAGACLPQVWSCDGPAHGQRGCQRGPPVLGLHQLPQAPAGRERFWGGLSEARGLAERGPGECSRAVAGGPAPPMAVPSTPRGPQSLPTLFRDATEGVHLGLGEPEALGDTGAEVAPCQ